MAGRVIRPISAGLNQVALMGRRDRARAVSELRRDHPGYKRLFRRLAVARAMAFAAAGSLALAVIMLVNRVPTWCSAGCVLVGLVAFSVAVVLLSDNRFDVLLAVVGAHRTDELAEELLERRLAAEEHARSAAHRGHADATPGAGADGPVTRGWCGDLGEHGTRALPSNSSAGSVRVDPGSPVDDRPATSVGTRSTGTV